MLIYSAQPETVEEVQAAIQQWLGGKDNNSNRGFSLSRIPHKTTLRVWIAQSAPDVKVEMNERCLLFQYKNQKLNLNLEKFLVRTAFEGKRFCLDIDRDPAPAHSFLIAMLRQFSHTKYPAFYTR